jgi:hypothetical protein
LLLSGAAIGAVKAWDIGLTTDIADQDQWPAMIERLSAANAGRPGLKNSILKFRDLSKS